MKKGMFLLLLVLVLALLGLSACGAPFTCSFCEEEKTGKSYTEEFYGSELVICQDCYSTLETLADGLKNWFD